MSKVRTILVDDEKYARDYLRTMIETYIPEIQLLGEATNVDSGIELISATQPQICLLDIDLGTGTAFDILDQLHSDLLRHSEIVLVTAYSQFMQKAWDYGVRDYVLKASGAEKTIEKLRKVAERILESKTEHPATEEVGKIPILQNRIIVPVGKSKQLVPIPRIMCLEGAGSQTTLWLQAKQYVMSFKLHDFEASLAPYGFVRVHKSFIVNLDYVEGIVRDKRQIFLELPKRRVPVGNEYRKNLPGV